MEKRGGGGSAVTQQRGRAGRDCVGRDGGPKPGEGLHGHSAVGNGGVGRAQRRAQRSHQKRRPAPLQPPSRPLSATPLGLLPRTLLHFHAHQQLSFLPGHRSP